MEERNALLQVTPGVVLRKMAKDRGYTNVNGERCGRPSVPPLRTERARMGQPRRFWGYEVKVKINVRGNGQEGLFHTGNVKSSGRVARFHTHIASPLPAYAGIE